VQLTAAGSRLLEKKAPVLAQERLFFSIAELSSAKQKQLSELLEEVVSVAGFAGEPATLFFEDHKKEERK
jgi:hypothetical protein